MNQKIIELALESGLAYRRSDGRCWIDAGFVDADLERFAELVRQDEREACAKAMQPMLRDMISRGQAVDIIRARNKHDSVN